MNQHGTALEWNGTGFLLVGPPGCGKSALAHHLMQHGAKLVADDQVLLVQENGMWMANCPEPTRGKIHLYEIGILTVPFMANTRLQLIFQSTSPATQLSMPPQLGLPVIKTDFSDGNIVTFIQNTLSRV